MMGCWVIFVAWVACCKAKFVKIRSEINQKLVQRGVQGSKIVKNEVQNLQKMGPKGVQMGSKSIKKVVEAKNASR